MSVRNVQRLDKNLKTGFVKISQ